MNPQEFLYFFLNDGLEEAVISSALRSSIYELFVWIYLGRFIYTLFLNVDLHFENQYFCVDVGLKFCA
jgi:hypothetical protein